MRTDGFLRVKIGIELRLWGTEVKGRNLAENVILTLSLEGCVSLGHTHAFQT